MKYHLLSLFALIAMLTACSNEETEQGHSYENNKQEIELSVSYDSAPMTRIGHNENENAGLGEAMIKYHWTLGDVIGVFTSSGVAVPSSSFNIKRGSLAEDGSNAIFQGIIDKEIVESPLYAIYPIPSVNINPASFEWNLANQDYAGKLNEKLACLTAVSKYEYPDVTESLIFKQQTAILNFNLNLPEGCHVYLDNLDLVLESPELYSKRMVDMTTQPATFKNGNIEPLTIALKGVKDQKAIKTKAYIFPTTLKSLKITLKDRTDTGIRFYGISLEGERMVKSGELYSVTANLNEIELKPGDAEEVPISVTTKDELLAIAQAVNAGTDNYQGKYIRLENNIDLSGEPWMAIGNTENTPFCGFFNGNGKTIEGMNVTEGNLLGLFGKMKGGYIKNLTVQGTITPTVITTPNASVFIGGMAAKIDGGCILSGNLQSEVNINYVAEAVHNIYAGGLFGFATPTSSGGYHILADTKFTYGVNDGTTEGISAVGKSEMNVGGIFGRIEGGTWTGNAIFTNNVKNVSVESAITANKSVNVGGLVGYLTGVNLESFEGYCNADVVYAKVIPGKNTLNSQIATGGLLGFSNAQNGFRIKEVASKTIVKGEADDAMVGGSKLTVWTGRATGGQGKNAGNTQKQNTYNNEKMTSDNTFSIGGDTRYINGFVQ